MERRDQKEYSHGIYLMFDIREYYHNNFNSSETGDISKIDEDLSSDLDNLFKNRFDNLYTRDRYKNNVFKVDIIYPKINYPGSRSLLITTDKVRFLLSFYPERGDLKNIEKIVIRPRYIEIGNIELSSIYMKQRKILVLYLTHPFHYNLKNSRLKSLSVFTSFDLEKMMNFRSAGTPSERNEINTMRIHPLWYYIAAISQNNNDEKSLSSLKTGNKAIDKFFIKRTKPEKNSYALLNDISFYYSRHGY